jgi:type IV secretion system protein VirB10
VPFSNDVNARKIAELEQNLSEEQRQSQRQLQAVKTTDTEAQAGGTPAPATQVAAGNQPQHDPIIDAERTLAFKSRFASNLVSADPVASRSSDAFTDSVTAPVAPQPADVPSAFPWSSATQIGAGSTAEQKRAPEVNVNSAHGQPYVLFEGTTLDTVLLNRLNGDFAGPVKVMLTNPIYSHDNQHLLIPEGTFLLGDTQKVAAFGQQRLAVTFHRLLMPDGYSVDLDKFHGLNQIGETGLNDQVNHHYVEIFGASIALGVIAGAGEATTNQGYYNNGSEAIWQGMAESLSASAAHVLDRFINILPTIVIREGHRIKVYITQDLLLPDYNNHAIPGNI